MGDAVVGEGIRGRNGSNLKGRLWRCHPSLGGDNTPTHGTGCCFTYLEMGLERLKKGTV